MDLSEFKTQRVNEIIKGNKEWGEIVTFIDFGNVNYWFKDDRNDEDGNLLNETEELSIDLSKLSQFVKSFSSDNRFYYGHDPQNRKSLGFIRATKDHFGKSRTFTKPLQKVRHYLSLEELPCNTRTVGTDRTGNFIYVPKCNFDVEICVDAIRLLDNYETICLMSGDADFVRLLGYLKGKGKKVIIIKAGYITHSLAEMADQLVNAQDIKSCLVIKKQKSSLATGLADSKPVSTGRCL